MRNKTLYNELAFSYSPTTRSQNTRARCAHPATYESNEALPPTNWRMPAWWRPSVVPVRGQETRAQRYVLSRPSAYGGFIPVERMILHYTRPASPYLPSATAGFIPVER